MSENYENKDIRFKLERNLPIKINEKRLTNIYSNICESGNRRKDECLYVDNVEKRYFWIYSTDVLNDNNNQIYPSFSMEEVPEDSVIRFLSLNKYSELLERFFPNYQK